MATANGVGLTLRPAHIKAITVLLRRFLGVDPGPDDVLQRIAPQALVDVAAQLGLIAPVYRALRAAGEAPAYAKMREAMRRPHLVQVARTVKAFAQSKAVVDALDSARVEHIPFKGPFLSIDLFGDPDARATTDIDIILPGGRADIDRALEALGTLGYESPKASPVVMDYYARECREFTLSSPGRLPVDLHYGSYPDLPEGAFAKAAARAANMDSHGVPRRKFRDTDTLAILATHYWGVPRGVRLKWLLDMAVLVHRGEVFQGDWVREISQWRAGCMVASALAGAARDLGVAPPRTASARLWRTLDSSERAVCRRVAAHGPEGVPFGLVQKVHRLQLPLKARYRAARKYLFPHPGRIALDAKRPDWAPGTVDRLKHAAGRLMSALKVN